MKEEKKNILILEQRTYLTEKAKEEVKRILEEIDKNTVELMGVVIGSKIIIDCLYDIGSTTNTYYKTVMQNSFELVLDNGYVKLKFTLDPNKFEKCTEYVEFNVNDLYRLNFKKFVEGVNSLINNYNAYIISENKNFETGFNTLKTIIIKANEEK